MKHIKDVKPNEEVRLRGWIDELRDLKKIKFIILRDKTGLIQITIKNNPKLNKVFENLTKESYIEVEGKVIESKVAKLGMEVLPEEIKIIAKSEQPLPIDISGKIETSLDKRLDWRFLDLRRPEVMKIFMLESKITNFLSKFCEKNGFTRIFTSKLVKVPTEGGAEYFEVKYFDKKAYLAQSPQFYKELALLSGLDKVYEIGPVFRAEPHHTTRHLCEYTSFDMEWVTNDMEEIMSFEEKMLRELFRELKIGFPTKIPRIKFSKAKKIVEDMGVKTEEGDLTPAGERALCQYTKDNYNSDFVFLTHFPAKHKVFYAKRIGEEALSFDLLYKGIEITTGGIREENYEKRKAQIIEKGFDPKKFDHLRFFKYGMPPHGGLAIGIERLTMKILNLENIREASLTPRDPDRLTP